MKRFSRTLCAYALAVTFSLTLAACKKSADQTAVKSNETHLETALTKSSGSATQVDISKNRESVQMADEGANIGVPADFPKDVYIQPGAKVQANIKTPSSMQLMLETSGDVAGIGKIYREKMKALGWEEKMATNMPQMFMLKYNKDQRTAIIQIGSNSSDKRVTVTLSITQDPAAK